MAGGQPSRFEWRSDAAGCWVSLEARQERGFYRLLAAPSGVTMPMDCMTHGATRRAHPLSDGNSGLRGQTESQSINRHDHASEEPTDELRRGRAKN